jgi:L-ascorbate metabolism protein UlaG (beta-lactamase superfamily)
MKITWFGHSAFLIQGRNKVLVDPFLTGNPMAPITADRVDCDIVCVTHGHGDHLGDAASIAKRTGATVASILELSNYLAKGGVNAVGFNIGGTTRILETNITLTPAIHSSSVAEGGDEMMMASPTGMIIDTGKPVYHAGDTCLFSDMKLIGDIYRPHVAMLPIGDFYTMGPAQAAVAVKLIRPKIAIPMHYGTFPAIRQDPKIFESLTKKQSKAKVVILKPGESLEV